MEGANISPLPGKEKAGHALKQSTSDQMTDQPQNPSKADKSKKDKKKDKVAEKDEKTKLTHGLQNFSFSESSKASTPAVPGESRRRSVVMTGKVVKSQTKAKAKVPRAVSQYARVSSHSQRISGA